MMNFSDEELKNVKSFSVSNDHGRIEWLGPIDARGLDLDSTVQITRGIVRVERLFLSLRISRSILCVFNFSTLNRCLYYQL